MATEHPEQEGVVQLDRLTRIEAVEQAERNVKHEITDGYGLSPVLVELAQEHLDLMRFMAYLERNGLLTIDAERGVFVGVERWASEDSPACALFKRLSDNGWRL